MKILLANKFYYRRGGDCIYTMDLEQLLKAQGHEVAVYSMNYPDNEPSPWSKYWPSPMTKLHAFTRPFGAHQVKRGFTQLMDDFKPDVVHLNNIHTQLSPVIAEIAHSRGAKVVWTIHDMKLLCPCYVCRRDGQACELCCDGEKIHCFKHSCMKGSRLASWIGYREAVKWSRARLEACTDIFLCPSKFIANKMIAGGFDKRKIAVLNNFIDINKCNDIDCEVKDYYCYVGRLSSEKGIATLIKAASRLPYKLKIIGDGPLRGSLESIASDNVEFCGRLSWNDIKPIVSHARFLAIPSEWYENNPLSVIEALCLGTPILGARIGGIPELIDEGLNGMTFTSADEADLADKIQRMFAASFDYHSISHAAKSRFDSREYVSKLVSSIYK